MKMGFYPLGNINEYTKTCLCMNCRNIVAILRVIILVSSWGNCNIIVASHLQFFSVS